MRTTARLRTLPCAAFILVALVALSASVLSAKAQWDSTSLTFRPVGVTANLSTFWTYGSREGIASSTDGHAWTEHPVEGGTDALLLGLRFPSESFGFGYGTGGALVFTMDGGHTWTAKSAGTTTILMASFADPDHGIVRTAGSVWLYSKGTLQKIPMPKQVPPDFKYVPDVVALSPEHMAFTVSEGWRSRTGFVFTNDGGQSWQFFEPPHIDVYQLIRSGDRYWAIGNETVGYDKPGGGYGVPAVLSSQDGFNWQHTSADVHACHWEGCHSCNARGCLASSALLVRPFAATVTVAGIPAGPLTTSWAATTERICAVGANIACARLVAAGDISKPGPPVPEERGWPPLRDANSEGILRCIACSVDPFFVDQSANGTYRLHVRLVVGPDGVPDQIAVENAPSSALQKKVTDEISSWLFEPPVQDGKPARVSTTADLTIQVVRPLR